MRRLYQPRGNTVMDAVIFCFLGASIVGLLIWALVQFWNGGGLVLLGTLSFALVMYLVALFLENH